MHLRRVLATVAAASVAALTLVGGAGAEPVPVSVTADPVKISTPLGGTFVFETTIANPTAGATEPLIAHLNLLSLRGDVYVEPEDWSTQRTWYLGSIPANDSRTITWQLKAVNGGSLAAYVAVLPQEDPAESPAVSPTVQIDVATRDTLSSGGILPLAVGIPVLLGLVAGGVRLARRRR